MCAEFTEIQDGKDIEDEEYSKPVGKINIKESPGVLRTNLGTDLGSVRYHLSNIDFSKPGIHILKLQPGLGKTYAIKKFLGDRENFLITTASHKLIYGEYERMGAKHWMKFKKKCGIYGEIEKLHSHGVSAKMICGLNHERCDRRKCDYWKQFQTPKAAAPITYLPTDRVLYQRGEKKGDFKFDVLIVDEAMKEFNVMEFDEKEMNNIIDVIDNYYPIRPLFDEFIGFLGVDGFPSLRQVERISELKNMALRDAIHKKEWDDVEKIAKLNIYELRRFIYYSNIHGNISSYPEPYLYYVFDLALQGIPVIFLDATFDRDAFNVILGRYIYENSVMDRQLLIDKELSSMLDLDFAIYESELENKDIDIYRMDKNNYYYKKGLFNFDRSKDDIISENGHKRIDEIRDYIEKTKRKYTSVGIITYLGLVPYFNDLGPTEYFFNNRGSNELKNVEALFIIGTPQSRPKDTIEEYNNLCMTNILPGDTYRMTYEKIKGGYQKVRVVDGKKMIQKLGFGAWEEKKPSPLTENGYDGYENELKYDGQAHEGIVDADVFYPLPDFDYNKAESEKYQAIQRARLFREGNIPEIYIFGDVPDQIKEEFNVINLDKKQTQTYFNGTAFTASQFKGIYPLPLFQLITETKIKNNSLNSMDIAQKLKLIIRN